ncbi:MAG TPA: transaldolase family protein [Anaerolineales bacterium]|nr:transaldolase family protein [Anaerolineales bacterium]
MTLSVVERLQNTNPDMEIWWDSSPLIFDSWVKKMVEATPAGQKKELEAQLKRLFVWDDMARSVFRGCTTNPPLSLGAIKDNPAPWEKWVDDQIRANPGITVKDLWWTTYKEVVRRGAEKLLPINEASAGRFGWVSGQLDPRLFTEKDQMVQKAQELAGLSPNVMVKVPGSQQGVEVVRSLTSMAISTNVTTCFTLPQIMAVARAAAEGVEDAKKNKVDLSRWRAVITHMLGRLTEREVIWEQAAYYKVNWTEADRRWFGLGVFKRAYRLLKEGGYPSKMLLCSVRPGPLVNGKMRFWDLQELAGADMVFTLPPYGLEPMFAMGESLDFREGAIDDPIPDSTIEKIYQMPYTMQAYEPHGLSLDQFNTHPATLYTTKDFSKAVAGVEEFVAGRLEKAGVKAAAVA